MIRLPPRSTLSSSSAASDVYKRQTLGKNNVSIAQVIQKNKIEDQAELVVITDLVLEQNFADALVEIKGMEHTREISTVIRVY